MFKMWLLLFTYVFWEIHAEKKLYSRSKMQIILLSVIFCKFIMHDNFSSKTDEVISLCGGVIIS